MAVRKYALLFALLFASLSQPVLATNLWVYALNISALPSVSYVNAPAYVTWSPSAVQANTSGWVSADQMLVLQTDMPYDPQHKGGTNWGVQIFTDNTQVGNLSPSSPPFNIPDGAFSGTVQPPLNPPFSTPVYNGVQSVFDTQRNQLTITRSGLVAANGQDKLPIIWRIYDGIPPASQGYRPSAIQQNPNAPNPGCSTPVACDFCDCSWFFMRDKGDQFLPPSGGQPQSNWLNNDWYQVPWNVEGLQETVCSPSDAAAGKCAPTSRGAVDGRFPPTPISGQPTQAYIYLATNFVNGTTQLYSTTIFIELYDY